MKKYLLLLFMVVPFFVSEAMAQKTISGKVTSEEDGSGLPGVNVVLKGTTTGTITDIEGNYKLEVPETAQTLVFSSIGYATREVPINGRSVIDVQMGTDVKQLTEVVVTAQAIEREKRTLGYAVSNVDGEEFTRATEVNLVDGLTGKIPGVQVVGTGGALNSSSRILIRGVKSLSGDNQPLFVVDGVPVYNSNILTGDDISGVFDAGNGAGEINPNDIASVTVLRGANAAALYGNRARNGVILITTKKGSKSKGARIDVSSEARFDNPLVYPDFQNQYTGGTNGKYTNTFLDGWGEPIVGQTVTNFQGQDEELTAFPDNYRDFLETGKLFINSVSVSGGDEKADYRIGLTSLNQNGITPNSDLDRYTIALNAGSEFSENFRSRIGVNYVNSENLGQVASGSNTPIALISNALLIPRTINLDDYRFGGGNQDSLELLSNGYPRLNAFNDSPWYTAEQILATQRSQRMFGFVQLEGDIFSWLTVTGRAGYDWRNDTRQRIVPKGTLGAEVGSFTDDIIDQKQLTTNVFATATFNLSEDFELTAIAGTEYNDRRTDRLTNDAQDLEIPGLYTPTNARTNNPTNDFAQRRYVGVYGDITLNYKNWAILNVTGRNDWTSTLPVESRSYFYPSVSASFVFSEALDLTSNFISYGKLRGSYARVGSDTGPYLTSFRFLPVNNIRGQFGQGNNFPFFGQPGFAANNILPNQNLTPEFTTSIEAGFDLSLWNDRIDVDFTWYTIDTEDQIIEIPVSESTGFSRAVQNVGVINNTGVELGLAMNLLQVGDFVWNTRVNFTRNVFETKELPEGVEQVTVEQSFSGFAIRAEEGEDLGLYGTSWQRDSITGRPIISPTTGLRLAGENQRLGDLNPDFLLGWQNNFSWRGFNLSFLIDWKKGGKIFSSTNLNLRNSGLSEETAVGREGGIIDAEGVILDENGVARDNDIAVTPELFWTNYSSAGVLESSIFDADFVKLREIQITYSFSPNFLDQTPFRTLSFGITGRNVALLYSKTQHIDPESSLFQSASLGAGSEERFGVPSTRSIGFNLKLGF